MVSESVFRELGKIKHEQLEQYFDERDTSGKPWNTAAWQEKRDELIGDECEWCGDAAEDTVFHLHHDDFEKPNYERLWIEAENAAFANSAACDPDVHLTGESTCPGCGYSDYYARKTLLPIYRCNNCGTTFDQAPVETGKADDPALYTVADAFYPAKLEWVREHTGRVRERFDQRIEAHWQEYLSLETTITICQGCHFMHHKRGMTRCDRCGENWHRTKKEKCWDCIVDENGLAECEACGDGWYDPAKNDQCRECR